MADKPKLSWKIRSVESEDVSQILDIYTPEVIDGLASWELEPPTLADMQARVEQVVSAGYPWLVAENHGRIGGYAYASSFRPRPGYRFCVEDSVYIHPDARGNGLGKLLLTALISECANKGFRQMVAVIGDSANEASVRLHASVGFEHAGVLRNVGFKKGRWLDSVNMQLALGKGADTLPDNN